MAVARATISRDIWDTVRAIIVADSGVTSLVASTKIFSAYPFKFIDKAGGLPFIVIHKPNIDEEKLTMRKKKYNVQVNIDSVADKAATVKDVQDAIRAALESGESTTRSSDYNMFDYRVIADTDTQDLRDEKRIHVGTLTIAYTYLGGGAN